MNFNSARTLLLTTAFAVALTQLASASRALAYNQTPASKAACSAEVLTKMKGALAPDVLTNKEQIVSLFDRAAAGEISCEQTTTPIEQSGGSITMCGAGQPEAYHDLKFNAGTNTITLRVLEVSVQCGGMGYWLTDITSDRASIVQATGLGKKKFSLLRHKVCSKLEELVQISFKTESEDGQKSVATRILSLSEAVCENEELTETIIEL